MQSINKSLLLSHRYESDVTVAYPATRTRYHNAYEFDMCVLGGLSGTVHFSLFVLLDYGNNLCTRSQLGKVMRSEIAHNNRCNSTNSSVNVLLFCLSCSKLYILVFKLHCTMGIKQVVKSQNNFEYLTGNCFYRLYILAHAIALLIFHASSFWSQAVLECHARLDKFVCFHMVKSFLAQIDQYCLILSRLS